MNNERYNQVIDEVWKKYLDETRFTSSPEWLEPVPVMDMKTGEGAWGARQYHRNDFINKCKNDEDFSKRWGLKIEERKFSLEERHYILTKTKLLIPIPDDIKDNWIEILNENNIPTKQITLTYKDEKIENYERK